ncbi:MAG: phosphoribosylaminoimidazolesuccinocarboxamide synthase, partial [Bacteriovoracaceae bacterium]
MPGPIKKIQGSAKDILFQDDNMFFEFSDRYSIYDWGEMPDLIENKGANLFKMGVFFFEHLQSRGFKTHFLGVQNDLVQVKKFRVIKPELIDGRYNYSKIQQAQNNFLIPLEVIFRFGAPQGSSLLKANHERLRELGLKKVQENEKFENPLIEFSTKLEPSDRMLFSKEALEISGLCAEKFKELKKLASSLALALKELTDLRGLELWDGKFEFALDEKGELVLIDSVGVDELRLTLEGAPLSKECLRQFYAKSDWRRRLLERKSKVLNWKELMLANEEIPAPLPLEALKMARELYQLLHDVLAKGEGLERLRRLSKDIQAYLKPKRALVIGDGGREHALALKLSQSPQVEKVFIQTKKRNIYANSQIETIPIENESELLDFIKKNSLDLILIGPEQPLVDGLADKLRGQGAAVFGPGKAASQLEASKAFSKKIMLKAGIPTALYESFSDYQDAMDFLEKTNWPDGYVVKADGLA